MAKPYSMDLRAGGCGGDGAWDVVPCCGVAFWGGGKLCDQMGAGGIALRCDRIDAPCVPDQPINAQSFTDYVEQWLVPTLSPGDVVITDNLSSHKKQAIRAVGARLLFLPPYSPDLNPIEQVPSTSLRTGFAKPKHLMRKAAERFHKATWRRIGTLLDDFSATECRNYLVNSGYAST